MQEQSIDLLREEARRLLSLELGLLHHVQEGAGVLADDQGDEHQTFSKANVAKEIGYLEGELIKVGELKMVLAVVGTMKAGKSTTINAIVGHEVLPNRNRPMTALPTLIEHTPGQIEPVLELQNCKPINDLISQLGKVVSSDRGDAALQNLERTDDMLDLLKLIDQRGSFKVSYEGSENIFWFLKSLNDLVRLAAHLEVEFPFGSYSSIDDYPVIRIEFSHLGQAAGQGKLALLDTPGPNEAGQQHLRKMLKEQLKKASAVLAVMDFTQLKSDADEQVRKELDEIADIAEGRLFALVNKFDQRDRNGDTAEQTRTFVAESLMNRRLNAADVYPVSSRWGYLASRAQQEVVNHGKLPELNGAKNAWVEDFGQLVLGMDWEDALQDTEHVQRGASHLWKKSNFAEPLEKVIFKAHRQAAVMALSSAASKLVDTATRLARFLEVRDTALAKSAEELQEQIGSLRDDIAMIDRLEQDSEASSQNALAEIKCEMSMTFTELAEAIKHEVGEGFKAGKRQEQQQAVARMQDQPTTTMAGLLKGVFSTWLGGERARRARTGFDFEYDEESPVINFDKQSQAEALLKKIEDGVQSIISDGEVELVRRMGEILKDFRITFAVDIEDEANKLINGLNERLNRSGFAIDVKIPDTAPLTLKYTAGEILRDSVDSKHRKVTRSRRSKGAWGTICSWFGTSDWGWEEYTVKQGYYAVDINKVRKAIDASIEQLFKDLEASAADTIAQPLNEGLHTFFEQLKGSIESIRSDLQQSIRDQERSQDEQIALASLLSSYKREVMPIKRDSEELLRDVSPAGVAA
ncbi:replication fork clamp-binding protein CrfC [Pseudomonas sp. OG7]|uniref:dynamin family protein n=1 Tax=unclassified Pseudomonas TaxID=196821 RepID=UPI0016195B22|nr:MULTISPECIES: dynamin family protein [unclassified Pseudomonas]MBB3269695.1 replication fork clamp-binding protein CrfC [Pseudomonas sp. OG7]MDI3368832.1 dynamin family protein [Pseudomonas sp. V104_10]